MTIPAFSRRTIIKQGAALASLSVLHVSGPVYAFDDVPAGEVVPWLDKLEANPVPEIISVQIDWEKLDSWLTPTGQHFVVMHYGIPDTNEDTWKLELDGLVAQPLKLSLEDLKARPRREMDVTLECAGNTGLPFFNGGVSNASWAGTPLAPLLKEAGVLEAGIEVVFWGSDAGEQKYGDLTVTESYARSMSVADALSGNNLLAWEMNGKELPAQHGYPIRLIAPEWYGMASVKWLNRISVLDRRYQGTMMANLYVTIREEEHDGQKVYTFTSVGPNRLKSAPAKVIKSGDTYSIFGAAWGRPIASVDVRVDKGDWQPAKLTTGKGSEFAWVFWTLDWPSPTAGEHTITTRATSVSGEIQPAPDDPFLAGKKTYFDSNGQITRRVRIG
jgi:DMSO/TMAO reductase YedYZ molybdopterin-dependent catalytic subunit